MRIISGSLRGRRLRTPKGLSTRPATDRVRESMFNLISARRSFDDIDVLDLFCGTGALGLEAVSRGARRATFVELQKSVLNIARGNAEQFGVADQCTFLQRDAIKFTARLSSQLSSHRRSDAGRRTPDAAGFDLVFADPPYQLDGIVSLPELVLSFLKEGGLFLLEHDRHLSFDEVSGWSKSRAYGRTIVSIFETIQEDE